MPANRARVVLLACAFIASFGALHFRGLLPWSTSREHTQTSQYLARQAGIELMPGWTSYSSREACEARFRAQGAAPITRVARHAVPSASYPPYDFDSLRVVPYRHLDHPGAVTLQFFNDRLFQVEFVPDNARAYARAREPGAGA